MSRQLTLEDGMRLERLTCDTCEKDRKEDLIRLQRETREDDALAAAADAALRRLRGDR